jgi:hypothetical protein
MLSREEKKKLLAMMKVAQPTTITVAQEVVLETTIDPQPKTKRQSVALSCDI